MNEDVFLTILPFVLIAVLGIGIFYVLVIRWTKKKGYDERQELIRGRGFKIGFMTLFYFNIAYGLLTGIQQALKILDLEPNLLNCIDPFRALEFGTEFSFFVFALYCIWHDAFFSLHNKLSKNMILYGILTLLFLVDGDINDFIIGIMLLVLYVASLMRYFIKQKQIKGETHE